MMTHKMKVALAAAGIAAFAATGAVAQEVVSSLTAFEVVEKTDDQGVKTVVDYMDLDNVVPGDRVLYRVSLKNQGEDIAQNLRFEMPLHSSMLIDMETISGDGGFDLKFATFDAPADFAVLEALTVQDEQGESVAAGPGDLAAVQVSFTDLQAEGEVELEYIVTIR